MSHDIQQKYTLIFEQFLISPMIIYEQIASFLVLCAQLLCLRPRKGDNDPTYTNMSELTVWDIGRQAVQNGA